MNAATLVDEATRYLEAIDLFRSMEMDVRWRSEADEVGQFNAVRAIQSKSTCDRCADPRVRINGRRFGH
jgi:hypothetical protein